MAARDPGGEKHVSRSGRREHTILLSRERVNKGTQRMNSLPLSVPLSPVYAITGKPLLSNPT